MRSGKLPFPSQCLVSGDSWQVLGLRGKRPATSSSTNILAASLASPRLFSDKTAPPEVNKPRFPVIKKSLERTLEAQRTANRERVIIHRVYNGPATAIDREEQVNNGLEPQSACEEVPVPIVKRIQPDRKNLAMIKQENRAKQQRILSAPVNIPWIGKGNGSVPNPWLEYLQTGNGSRDAKSSLGRELSALADFLSPSAAERLVVDAVHSEISERLQELVPSLPRLVGSRSTHIASSSSAVDLMVPLAGTDEQKAFHTSMNARAIKMYNDTMTKVEVNLRNNASFEKFLLSQGKSPAFVMTHKASGLTTRLFCGSYLPKSDVFMRTALADLPSLQPLYMALRVLLESRGIFGWKLASLDPYGLFLLVTSFLRQQNLSKKHEQEDLGEQLLALLDTYGKRIDLTKTGISVEPASYFTTSSVREEEKSRLRSHTINKLKGRTGNEKPAYLIGQRSLMRYKINAGKKGNQPVANHLCIQDPTNSLNDVGLRCIRTAELQETLSKIHHEVQLALQRWNEGDRCNGSILGLILPHTNFDELLRRRKMVLSA